MIELRRRASLRCSPTPIIPVVLAFALAACAPGASTEPADSPPLRTIDVTSDGAFPLAAHLEIADLAATMSFDEVFEAGDRLFHVRFRGPDGVGVAKLPDGTPLARFSVVPPGRGAGAPISSQACGSCHLGSAFGPATMNVAGDPGNDGEPPFNTRNTTSLFGNGALQLLAWEITEELGAIREQAEQAAREQPGTPVERALESKGIDYGTLRVVADADGAITVDAAGLKGIDPDLVVRPLGSKGNIPNLRTIVIGAAAGLMGMQAEELVMGLDAGPDPDGDGVERELSMGDITAMVIYNAGQETPQELADLAAAGWVATPSDADAALIESGRQAFEQVGCASCHVPSVSLDNTVFEEPTARGNGNYYNQALADGVPGYDPDNPVRFDVLTAGDEPRLQANPDGGATVRLYGDLKRHAMGRQLADPGGPTPSRTASGPPLEHDGSVVLIPAATFLTPELWGVGNSGPWLHDGRAASLSEAILWHGEDEPPAVGEPGRSEAQESRDAFAALDVEEQKAVVAFLRSLRTFRTRR